MFVNPGGPGGSGVDFNFSFGALGSPELSEAYDLVGSDSRGVGTSDPLGCLDTVETAKDLDVMRSLVGDEGSMPTHPIKEPAAAARSEGIWALVVRDGLVWWRSSD